MIGVNINGKDFRVPQNWAEVTTEVYQRVKGVEDPDVIRLFSAVVGQDFRAISESTDEDLDFAMYQVVSFILNTDEYFRQAEPPMFLEVGGNRYKIEKNLEAMTIEQNLVVRQRMAKAKFLEEVIAFAIAVYLQPKIDGRFSMEAAQELEKEVLKMPIEDTFPVGFFLLRRLRNFGRSGGRRWLLPLTWWTNLSRRSLKWPKSKGLRRWLTLP